MPTQKSPPRRLFDKNKARFPKELNNQFYLYEDWYVKNWSSRDGLVKRF